MTDNKQENKQETLHEEERKTELSMENLEQVCGGANPSLMGPAAVAAYSYMALVPVIQPPV